jgi:hypothetical protein
MPLILQRPDFKTTKILHDDPEVWRVWWQLWEIRVALHKIFPCVEGECFFHPHPWPSTVRCLKWGYNHRLWVYNGLKEDIERLKPEDIEQFSNWLVPFDTTVRAGDLYLMPDIRQFHQVSTPEINYSLMIIGTPYFPWATKQFSRKSPDKSIELTRLEVEEVMWVAREYFK